MDFRELLEKLGLTSYEKKVYLALLKLQEAKGQELVKESEVPRGRIYDTLDSLIKKGLVTELPTKPKKYKLNEPRRAIKSFIGEKQGSLGKLKQQVDEIKIPRIVLKDAMTDEFEIIASEKLYFQRLKEFKLKAKKEFISIISGRKPPRYVSYETRQMLKKGVKYKTIIASYNKQNESYVKEKIKLGSQIRAYPINGIRFMIIDRKEILISIVNNSSFEGLTVYTTNKDFIDSMLEFFGSVWEKGKVIK
jgi:HTH-type transcriptional regulator, sugar sensing transcriptional regulator